MPRGCRTRPDPVARVVLSRGVPALLPVELRSVTWVRSPNSRRHSGATGFTCIQVLTDPDEVSASPWLYGDGRVPAEERMEIHMVTSSTVAGRPDHRRGAHLFPSLVLPGCRSWQRYRYGSCCPPVPDVAGSCVFREPVRARTSPGHRPERQVIDCTRRLLRGPVGEPSGAAQQSGPDNSLESVSQTGNLSALLTEISPGLSY